MITFSASEVKEFYKQHNEGPKYFGYRIGQAFHSHFKLEKITGSNKDWCDELYSKDGEQAKAMIAQVTDHTQ